MENEEFRMLFSAAYPGETCVIVFFRGRGKGESKMQDLFFLVGQVPHSKGSIKIIQRFFLCLPEHRVFLFLAEKQRNPVVGDAYGAGIVFFRLGQPFMVDDTLLAEIIDQVVHGMLKRQKLALCQAGFRNIKIDEGHNKQYGGGNTGTKQCQEVMDFTEHGMAFLVVLRYMGSMLYMGWAVSEGMFMPWIQRMQSSRFGGASKQCAGVCVKVSAAVSYIPRPGRCVGPRRCLRFADGGGKSGYSCPGCRLRYPYPVPRLSPAAVPW